MRILGISAYYHDSAATLVEDGHIVAAAQEERFTRLKGDASFPHHAVAYCLDTAGIQEREIDRVVFYENPYAKFERLLTTYHLTAPRSLSGFLRSMPSWLTEKLWLKREIADELGVNKHVHFCDHHMSHAASAFFPSPFQEAAILTVDGVGEWSTATYGIGINNQIKLSKHIRFPNSLGLLYSAFTFYTGFKINSGEYKLMGLAPYGEPKYAELILQKLVKLMPDGAMVLNQDFFNYASGLTMTNSRFHKLFGGPPRKPESPVTQKEMNIAASIQVVLNEAILRMGKHVYQETGQSNLTMAGGVALNAVATGFLLRNGPFKHIWIQPAAGDAGGSLGCALWFWHQVLDKTRQVESSDSMQGAFLGLDIPPCSPADDSTLSSLGAVWEVLSEQAIKARIVENITEGKIVAIARGRAEFGPRALGNRSILADARSKTMQRHLNLKIKFRESFRPFAPMVLAEDAADYFEVLQESPYMLFCYPLVPSHTLHPEDAGLSAMDRLNQVRSDIPAVTHIDYSSRIQTIDPGRNSFMYDVLSDFKKRTGCSVIVNTSFNVRGEPIINTVEDAYRCFMATELDCLVIGNRFLERDRQTNRPLNDTERATWMRRFELD